MGLFNRKNSTSFWSKKIDSMGPPISKEQKNQLNAFLYTKPEPAKEVCIQDTDGFLRFDFSNIPVLNWKVPGGKHEKRYILKGRNKTQAIQDIMSLNELKNLSKYDTKFKKRFNVIEEEILFPDESNIKWNSGFSWLEVFGLTKTGKFPKYSVALHFYSQPKDKESVRRVSGVIYYLQNGQIGKFEITCMLKYGRIDMKHTMGK